MRRPLRILYILGYERSGSTFLQNVLAQHPSVVAVGEAHHLWDRGITHPVQCGCGKRATECEVWQTIFRRWFGSTDLRDLLRQCPECVSIRSRRKLWFLRSFVQRKESIRSRMEPYLREVRRFYEAVQASEPQALWIVDSSKTPVYGWILSLLDDVDVRYVHLVRSPEETEASVFKRARKAGYRYRRPFPGLVSLEWSLWNMLIYLKFSRSHAYWLLRYEHLLQDLQHQVAQIWNWMGLVPQRDIFGPGTVFLKSLHTFGGSPSRFRTGEVPVAPTPNPALSAGHRLLVRIGALPGTWILKRERRCAGETDGQSSNRLLHP